MSRGQTDRADFDALIGPHLDAGYRTALAILRDPDAAHDAVQESAFKAWRKLNQLRDGRPARPWFLAIVANQCRSERRRHWWSVIRMAEVESDVVASPDSTLIAENSSKSVGQLQGQNAPTTVIRRVSDRAILVKMDPSIGVLAFNSDDSLALLTTTPWVGGMPTALQVMDLRSRQPIWTYNGPGMFGNALAQPGGQDFAIYARKPTVEDPLTDLMIVHADGTATDFPQRFTPAW
jgi:hypothetical protein